MDRAGGVWHFATMDGGGRAQRSAGAVGLSVCRRGPETVLARLYQAGALRLRLVRAEHDGFATAVLLNTGGGVAGGDCYDTDVVAMPGSRLVLTTQGAERVYRAGIDDAPARIAMTIGIAVGAVVEYLPQETILFDQAALARQLRVEISGAGRYLGVESLIFGRAAMGERIERLDLSDQIQIMRDGRLVFLDHLRPPMDFAKAQGRAAMLGGAGAMATIILVDAQAERWVTAVRAALVDEQAGASAWNQLLVVRILAPTGERLRGLVREVLAVLREDRAMPRVWGC